MTRARETCGPDDNFQMPVSDHFRKSKSLAAVEVCLLVAIIASGCATTRNRHPAKGQANVRDWSGARLIMLPFMDAAAVLGAETGVRNPFTRRVYLTGKPDPEAAAMLTGMFLNSLRKLADVSVKQVNYDPELWPRGMERETALELARSYNADGVLAGCLYLFRQRRGKRYSVVEPAAVAFDVVLLDARNGRIAWKGVFIETQQALSENLLSLGDFVRRGGRWLTAEELARDGIEKVLKTFPGRRK